MDKSPEARARWKATKNTRLGAYRKVRDCFRRLWLEHFPQGRNKSEQATKNTNCLLTKGALPVFAEHLDWHLASIDLALRSCARAEFGHLQRDLGDLFNISMTCEQRAWGQQLRMAGEDAISAHVRAKHEAKLVKRHAKQKRYRDHSEARKARKQAKRIVYEQYLAKQREQAALRRERTQARKDALAERAVMLKAWNAKYKDLFQRTKLSKDAARRRREMLEAAADKPTRDLIKRIHDGPCKCFWCGRKMMMGGTVDHVIPLKRGGKHDTSNLVAACAPCNGKKHDTMPNEVDLPLGPTLLLF